MYNFITMVGDVNPFEHGGVFVFKDGDDYVAIRVDNIKESYGRDYVKKNAEKGYNEESSETKEFYIFGTIFDNRPELKARLESCADLDPDTASMVDYIHALTAYGWDYDLDTFHTHNALAQWLMGLDEESEGLKGILESYMSEEGGDWKRYILEVEVEAYTKGHAEDLVSLGVDSSMINSVRRDDD